MTTKQVTVQAQVNGTVVFDKTVDGKKNQIALMRECMKHLDALNAGDAVLRVQTVGAKTWARFGYVAGSSQARQDQTLEF